MMHDFVCVCNLKSAFLPAFNPAYDARLCVCNLKSAFLPAFDPAYVGGRLSVHVHMCM